MDTIAYINILVDLLGQISKYDDGASSLSSPELIIGYKKLLSGSFKIDYKKALSIGKKEGLKGILYWKLKQKRSL